jgi:hypothetical protein
MATISRARPAVVNAAAPVCRPGEPPVVDVADPVGLTCTIVVEVMVLRLPSGMVVVLLNVEVKELPELVAEVVGCADEVDVVPVVVERVEGTDVEVVLETLDDELSDVVVVAPVEVAVELELELELELVVLGTVGVEPDEVVSVVSALVVGSLLELVAAADEVEADSEVVELS